MGKHDNLIVVIQKLLWATMAGVAFTVALLAIVIALLVDPTLPTWIGADPKPLAEQLPIVDDGALALLADDPNLELIKANCTVCHSARLVVQYRASRDGWESVIRWMQRTQKLWDLGANEPIILDYLAKNYAPAQQGRRKPLQDIEWYDLD